MLRKCKAAYHAAHDNGDHFAVVYDHAAGRPDRYTIFVWRIGKTAKIIGREIDLAFAKEIVNNYPKRPWLDKP
jgi:hypothetical protein